MCHLAALCAASGLKALPFSVDDLLIDIYYHFKHFKALARVLHFGVGISQIEWNMKVKIEISICTGLMLNDHSNPYIDSYKMGTVFTL